MKLILIILILILVVGLGPILTIWSINELFNTGINITFFTYLSALWLGALVYGARK